MNILFVDDEAGLLDQAKLFLEREDDRLNVETAASVEQAKEMFKEKDYDGIISDYKMPDTDGLEFLKWVKERDEGMAFIIFTGKGREEVAMEALNLGADRYLQKGGDPKAQYKVLTQAIIQEITHKQTRIRAEESERMYKTIFEHTATANVIIEEDTTISLINDRLTDLFGYAKEEVIGRPCTEFVDDLDLPMMKRYHDLRRKKLDEVPNHYEFKLIDKEGEKRDVLITVGIIPGTNKSIASLMDITEQKEAEKKIKQLHNVATSFESCESEEEVYEIAVDAAEKILDFDMCSLDIVEDGMFVVKATSSEISKKVSVSRPVDYGGIGTKTLRGKESIVIDDLSEDDTARPTRSEFRSAISVPIGDMGVFQAVSTEQNYFDKGDLEMAELLISHVNETVSRIRSFKAMQEEQEKYRMITENAYDMIALLDLEGNILFANRAHKRVLGYEPDELIGKNSLDHVHPDDREKIIRDMQNLIEKGGQEVGIKEYRCIARDGSEVTVQATGELLRDPEGNIDKILLIKRDITSDS